jgi:arylsulfatase A-like enzyme
LLRDHGYRTSMVGKWHLGFAEMGYDVELPGGPVDRGFDSFFGMRASTDIPPYFYIRDRRAVTPPTGRIQANQTPGWSPVQGAFWRAGRIAPDLELDEVLPRFTSEAVAVIEEAAKDPRPFFLHLAYTGPHTPWLPSAAYRGKSKVGLYGDFVMMLDAEVGRVLDALDRTGAARDTLVIFTSDNGPVWYPEDVERFGHDSAGGLRGMKGDAWEAGHRMPFLVRWPGRVKAGGVSHQTICFTDLLATFADIQGAKLQGSAGPDSFSILPVLEGRQPGDEPVRGPLVMQSGSRGPMVIRDGDWKYIDAPGSGGFSKSPKPRPGDPPAQLYHLREDPGERRNLYHDHPDKVRELKQRLKAVVESPRTRPD